MKTSSDYLPDQVSILTAGCQLLAEIKVRDGALAVLVEDVQPRIDHHWDNSYPAWQDSRRSLAAV